MIIQYEPYSMIRVLLLSFYFNSTQDFKVSKDVKYVILNFRVMGII